MNKKITTNNSFGLDAATFISNDSFSHLQDVTAEPLKEAIDVAKNVKGQPLIFSEYDESLLKTLISLNIVLSTDEGWIRGYNWDKYVKHVKYEK